MTNHIKIELPPLPKAGIYRDDDLGFEHIVRRNIGYTADQMREYAIAAWNTRANTPASSAAQPTMTDDERRALVKVKWSAENNTSITQLSHADILALAGLGDRLAAQPSDATVQPRVDLMDEQIMRIAEENTIVGNLICEERSKEKVLSFAKALLANTAQGKPEQCPTCRGNDADAPCAYPSCGMTGCLRDKRLAAKKG